VLLEPIMKVEVVTPEDYSGDVIGGSEPPPADRSPAWTRRPPARRSPPEVPLSEMFGYATTVRSMSQGRATFHHGIREIRGSAAEHRGRNHQESNRPRTQASRKNAMSKEKFEPQQAAT